VRLFVSRRSGCVGRLRSDFFYEIDVTRTIRNDHMTGPGYNRLLFELVRLSNNDFYFKFNNDVMSIE
jgi:hypothetical protein